MVSWIQNSQNKQRRKKKQQQWDEMVHGSRERERERVQGENKYGQIYKKYSNAFGFLVNSA